ncbi:MAG: hypothetical protein LUF88_02825 [Bacteroides fragilis]|nr:hypothetical protein [Bacteroides fragilis]
MYIRSDHDYSRHYTSDSLSEDDVAAMQSELDGDPDLWTVDMGDFVILGINKSWKSISDETLAEIEAMAEEGKPIILVTHVPFDSLVDAGFRQTVYDIRGIYNLWGLGNRYVPDENMVSLMELIYADDSPIEAVIGAHLHFQYDAYLTNDLMEYVFAPAYEGSVGVLHVVGEE